MLDQVESSMVYQFELVQFFAVKVRCLGRTGVSSSVITRNSPLWTSNPKQQLAYLALKYWARLYCPDVILGVYTPDDWKSHRKKSSILCRYRIIER